MIEEKLNIDEYCFEQDENNTSQWNVLTCEKSDSILSDCEFPMLYETMDIEEHKTFIFLVKIVTTSVTLFFFTLTIFTYFCINELSLHGKCVIAILSSLTSALIFSRVGFFYYSKIFDAFFDAFLATAIIWIGAATFDVWWTLK